MTKYVITTEIKAAVKGRETEVLDALAIPWRDGRPQTKCPYPDHDDANPSWRWDHKASKAHCTCSPKDDSIFDVVMRRAGGDFEAAKLQVAEMIGRRDLVREKNAKTRGRGQIMDAASLLNPPPHLRDDQLVRAYLGHRLRIAADAVPLPTTPIAGWRSLPYFDPASQNQKGAKPSLVGHFPCAIFGTVAADGRTHAHRIYLAPGGVGKADVGVTTDGGLRDSKKSAKRIGTDTTAGRSVMLWGDAGRAGYITLCEGVENRDGSGAGDGGRNRGRRDGHCRCNLGQRR